jgi:hypothetical protein
MLSWFSSKKYKFCLHHRNGTPAPDQVYMFDNEKELKEFIIGKELPYHDDDCKAFKEELDTKLEEYVKSGNDSMKFNDRLFILCASQYGVNFNMDEFNDTFIIMGKEKNRWIEFDGYEIIKIRL